jgi:hypothetical protein
MGPLHFGFYCEQVLVYLALTFQLRSKTTAVAHVDFLRIFVVQLKGRPDQTRRAALYCAEWRGWF